MKRWCLGRCSRVETQILTQQISRCVFAGILALSVILGGCGPKGVSFYQVESSLPSLQPDHGRLYLLNTSVKQARLAFDDETTRKIDGGTFFWHDVPAGHHVITADIWGDFGAWKQQVDVTAGHDHFIRIKDRRAAAIATGLFGALGNIAEAATATEGQSGPFELEVVDVIVGKEERAKLVFVGPVGSPMMLQEPARPLSQPVAARDAVAKPSTVKTTSRSAEPSNSKVDRSTGCSVDQILSMRSSGLRDAQIKAACK